MCLQPAPCMQDCVRTSACCNPSNCLAVHVQAASLCMHAYPPTWASSLLFWDCSSFWQGDEELEMFDMESERAYERAEAGRVLVVSPVPGQQRGSVPGK